MNPWLPAILITFAFWATVCGSILLFLNILKKSWHYREVRRWTYRALLALGSVFVLVIASSEDPQVQRVAVILSIGLIAVPATVMLFIQFSFWIYHGLIHGDPFYEAPLPGERGYSSPEPLQEPQKRQKKLCPICKRYTRCKVYDGRKGGIPFHRIRD